MKSFSERIDKEAIEKIEKQNIPEPIDALNLVTLKDKTFYLLYGLLIAPILYLKGVRPIWVGIFRKNIFGEKLADEIVIARYPNINALTKTISSKYYSFVNTLREKGVKKLNFSLTTQTQGMKKIQHKGYFLVVAFNSKGDKSFLEIKTLLEKKGFSILYVSKETSSFQIMKSPIPSDTNPTKYKNLALFKVQDMKFIDKTINQEFFEKIKKSINVFSIQLFETQKISELIS